ncbi:hypothetical protein N7G274_004808 [Stereocaulon virgatum]|uniref:Uncharacterized protein n=1 Tax=Stereocaulon virgatum TaxID=373712 RepID=A0ABR4AC99_9LECA
MMTDPTSPGRDASSRALSIMTDDRDRPLSMLSTTSHSPQIIPAPRSPTRSLATEVFDSRPFQRSSTGASNHTFTSSYPPSIEEDEPLGDQQGNSRRLSFVSGISEQYARPVSPFTSKVPPAPRNHNRASTMEKEISAPTAVSDSLGFTSRPPDILSTRMASTRAIKSPRDSTASTIESLADIEAVNDYQAALRNVNGDVPTNHETWQLRTPRGSPTPPRDYIHQLTQQGPASPFIVSDVATKSSSIVDSPAASRPNLRAPKASRLNFLPKFLRFAPKEKDQPPAVPMKSPRRLPGSEGDPASFFDGASSVGDVAEIREGYGYEIQDARQAIVGSPVVVKHGSNTKVELKEMLRSTPPAADNPGPSKRKAAAILGDDFGELKDHNSEVKGIHTGLPQEQLGKDPIQDIASTKSGPLGLGSWKEINPFTMSVLRSHQSLLNPISSSVPAPAPPPKSAPPVPVTRSVSFPAPRPLDIRPEHRFLRQSIVSTPYPSGTSAEKEKKRKEKEAIRGAAEEDEDEKAEALKAVLTLVLYGNNNPIPKVETIVLPSSHGTPLIDATENGHPLIMASQSQIVDDEHLFTLLRSTYKNMRGPLRHFVSARNVCSLKLHSYKSMSQLACRQGRSMQFRGDDVQEEIAETRMFALFQKPRMGRRRKEWAGWVRKLPENATGESEDKERIAIEFVEGWAVGKLCLAVVAVLFLSFFVLLLWIFVGKGGSDSELQNAVSSSPPDLKDLVDAYSGLPVALGTQFGVNPTGYKGSGGRVETGAVLGMLVLMFGWTGIGAWVGLSWLVM